MIKKQIIISVIYLLLTAFTFNAGIDTIALLDLKGNTVKLNQLSKYKATALFFLSPECPLCQSYTLTINNLQKKYNDKSINFIGIVPTKNYSVNDINEYKRSYKSTLTILRDIDNKLVDKIGATITPEVFLVNDKGVVLYSGRIDNWAIELGRKRTVITQFDLINAIDLVLKNQPIKVKKTKAIGCFIE